MKIYESLAKVQAEIKAPKDLYNKFGGYKYRSVESITEAAKPVLKKYNLALFMNDEIVSIDSRFYVKSTATIAGSDEVISVSAFAREEDNKKGMDAAQVTGAATSYARKMALGGLFALDDSKDADTLNVGEQEQAKAESKPETPSAKTSALDEALVDELVSLGGSIKVVATYFKKTEEEVTNEDILALVNRKKGVK